MQHSRIYMRCERRKSAQAPIMQLSAISSMAVRQLPFEFTFKAQAGTMVYWYRVTVGL
jgi:hypothetical protein